MREGEFRFSYFTREYEATVAFYRDGMALPVVGSWDRGSEDRGTLFGPPLASLRSSCDRKMTMRSLSSTLVRHRVRSW